MQLLTELIAYYADLLATIGVKTVITAPLTEGQKPTKRSNKAVLGAAGSKLQLIDAEVELPNEGYNVDDDDDDSINSEVRDRKSVV